MLCQTGVHRETLEGGAQGKEQVKDVLQVRSAAQSGIQAKRVPRKGNT